MQLAKVRNIMISGMLLFVAAFMVIYSFPRVMAHAWMGVGNEIYKRLPTGVSEKELNTFIESREKALEWVDLYQAKADLTILPLVSEQHRFQAYQAAQTLAGLLEKNPTDGFLWVRLGSLQERIAAPTSEVLHSWRQSHKYIKYAHSIAFHRIVVALRYRNFLTDADKVLVQQEIENFHTIDMHELRSLIRQYNITAAIDEFITAPDIRTFYFPAQK